MEDKELEDFLRSLKEMIEANREVIAAWRGVPVSEIVFDFELPPPKQLLKSWHSTFLLCLFLVLLTIILGV